MSDTAVQADTDIAVVRGFLGALDRLDIDAAIAFLDPTVVYQNVPFPAARGATAVEKQLRGMARYGTGFKAIIHNLAASDGVVLTERTDVIEIGRLKADFWVCGTFEVHDGKIVLWRDYFDFVNLVVGFAKGAVRALVGGRRR
jgi:limonene-1,2-epoxide hydrolase